MDTQTPSQSSGRRDLDHDLREIFQLVDRDGGGTIDMDELQQLMLLLGIPVLDGQMAKMVGEIASNGFGEITLEDFLRVMKDEDRNGHTKQLLLRDFELFRPANCPRGHIPVGELAQVLIRYFAFLEPTAPQGGDAVAALPGKEEERSKGAGAAVAEAAPRFENVSQPDPYASSRKWASSEILDMCKQIPPDCMHPELKDLVNFEKLVTIMIGDDERLNTDPFANDT